MDYFLPVSGALGFEATCTLLVQAGILSVAQAREAIVREERERARLVRQRVGRTERGARPSLEQRGSLGSPQDAVIHPAETLVAMDFTTVANPDLKISERMVMEVVARAANLPFVELDPLKI